MLGWEEYKIGREQKLLTVGNHIFGVIASVSSHYTVELVHFVPNWWTSGDKNKSKLHMFPWVLPSQYQQPPPSIHLCKSRESQVPTKESFVAIVSAPGASSCTSDSSSLVDLTSDECISGRQLPPQSEMWDGPRCGMVRPKNGSVWLPGHFTLFITGLWSLWCWSLAEIVSSPLTMVDSGPRAFFATASHSLSWNHALTTTFYWFVIMDKRSKLMTEGREPGKLWTLETRDFQWRHFFSQNTLQAWNPYIFGHEVSISCVSDSFIAR